MFRNYKTDVSKILKGPETYLWELFNVIIKLEIDHGRQSPSGRIKVAINLAQSKHISIIKDYTK